MRQAAGFSVVSARDYAAQVVALVRAAKKRIVFAAMVVRAGEESALILQAISNAARRGVAVHIVTDVFSQHMSNRPTGATRHKYRRECAQTREMLGEIHALGGTVDLVGRIGPNPYAGRYHVKATIIDDDVFSFGGVNLCDDAFAHTDYMLHINDEAIATQMQTIISGARKGLPATNTHIALSPSDTLLFDAGIKGQSIIYDRACELAAASTKVVYVSKMCPTGHLNDVLKQTQSTCYFNRPTKNGWHASTVAQLWDTWRSHAVNHYEGDTYIHAKCMLFELRDGTKAVLSGSHNFSLRGVAFGTKEIALQSTDPKLWRKLQDVVYEVATEGRTR